MNQHFRTKSAINHHKSHFLVEIPIAEDRGHEAGRRLSGAVAQGPGHQGGEEWGMMVPMHHIIDK